MVAREERFRVTNLDALFLDTGDMSWENNLLRITMDPVSTPIQTLAGLTWAHLPL